MTILLIAFVVLPAFIGGYYLGGLLLKRFKRD